MSPSVTDGALLCVAHPMFDFGEGLLDRIKIGRVRRQEPEPCACGFDDPAKGGRFVATEIDGVDAPQTASMCQIGGVLGPQNRRASMREVSTIGLDLAKRVFQAHGADASGAVQFSKRLRRDQLLIFFAAQPPSVVAMEACGSGHYWAREIAKLGHKTQLIAAQYVKPFVKRQKNDMADAEAICEAAQRPTMRFVSVKSEEKQAATVVFRARDLLVRQRTQLINALRGHLAEYGLIALNGRLP